MQDRIEFSYPPTFQPGYVGPLFSTSRRRILFLAYNPGVGQNNREGDKELSERLKTFATGETSFADFNRFLAGHLMNWPSLYSDNGVFREAGEGISLLPRLNRPSIRCVALLNFFPFKTIGNGNPRGGALKAAMWQYFVKPTIDLLQPNLRAAKKAHRFVESARATTFRGDGSQNSRPRSINCAN